MFGNPQWFRKKKFGWGLTPITVQGWIYALCWATVLAAPFALLVVRYQPAEAMIWLTVAGSLLVYDIRHIRRGMQPPKPADDVLYIGDDDATSERLATRNFEFQLRR